MKKILRVALLAGLLSMAGCSTHFSTLRPEGSTSQVIHPMPEDEAFRLAYSSMATTMPGRKITVLNGPVRGYSTYTRFVLDTYTQQVLVFRAQGVDGSGRRIQGYYFEVSGSGSSGSGRSTNVQFFESLSAQAQATRPGVAVTNLESLPYLAGATPDPDALSKAPQKQTQEETMQAIERLKGLRDRGVITDQEFQAKKAELLSRL